MHRRLHMKKGTRSRDPLTQNVDLCLDFSIRKAAIATGNRKIIGLRGRQKPPMQANVITLRSKNFANSVKLIQKY